MYFPGSPILVVEGTFAESVLLETVVLSVLNHDCAVASAASRMVTAAGGPGPAGRPLIEMGSRRTHESAAVAAARAAYIAGFASTSNLEARYTYGVPSSGTSAHAFTLVHDSEHDAFVAQLSSLGHGTTLLVDTYDVEHGVRAAVEAAGRLARRGADRQRRPARARGFGAGAARLARRDFDQDHPHRAISTSTRSPGSRSRRSTATVSAPRWSPGRGRRPRRWSTSWWRGPTRPLADGAPAGPGGLRPVAKRSVGKPGRGGRKWAVREHTAAGEAATERIWLSPPEASPTARFLLQELVRDGKIVGREPIEAARARHTAVLAELPSYAMQLSRGYPAIPTVFGPAGADLDF